MPKDNRENQSEKCSFRGRVERQVYTLRRIQVICLPVLVLAFIGMILTWGNYSTLVTFFRIIALAAFLGEKYCFFKARELVCPQCHKKVAYLLHDPSYSKTDGSLLLPKGLPPDVHQCPYCHADWESDE